MTLVSGKPTNPLFGGEATEATGASIKHGTLCDRVKKFGRDFWERSAGEPSAQVCVGLFLYVGWGDSGMKRPGGGSRRPELSAFGRRPVCREAIEAAVTVVLLWLVPETAGCLSIKAFPAGWGWKAGQNHLFAGCLAGAGTFVDFCLQGPDVAGFFFR